MTDRRGRERPTLHSLSAVTDQEHAIRVAFRNGDRQAFETLCQPHLDTLYTVVLRIVGSREIAGDVTQDALVRALSNCHQYDDTLSFRPWLLKIAVNRARDRLRTVWWRRVVPFTSERASTLPAADTLLNDASRDRLVRDALMHLAPNYREALTLYYLDDMTYAEMAEITDAAIPALKQRVRRGQTMLREKIQIKYPELVPARTSDNRES